MKTTTENAPITFQSEVAKEVEHKHAQLLAENKMLGKQLLLWKAKAESLAKQMASMMRHEQDQILRRNAKKEERQTEASNIKAEPPLVSGGEAQKEYPND